MRKLSVGSGAADTIGATDARRPRERVLPLARVDPCDMMSRTRRLLGDALISTGVLLTVVAFLVSIDERVREQLSMTASRAASASFADLEDQVRAVGSTMLDVARTQSLDYAPLMVFVVAATVLVLFMVRT
jgi:hypothetical protein